MQAAHLSALPARLGISRCQHGNRRFFCLGIVKYMNDVYGWNPGSPITFGECCWIISISKLFDLIHRRLTKLIICSSRSIRHYYHLPTRAWLHMAREIQLCDHSVRIGTVYAITVKYSWVRRYSHRCGTSTAPLVVSLLVSLFGVGVRITSCYWRHNGCWLLVSSCKVFTIMTSVTQVLILMATAGTYLRWRTERCTVILLFTCIAAFSVLRVRALCGKTNWVVVLTFCCAMFVPCINIVSDLPHLRSP